MKHLETSRLDTAQTNPKWQTFSNVSFAASSSSFGDLRAVRTRLNACASLRKVAISWAIR